MTALTLSDASKSRWLQEPSHYSGGGARFEGWLSVLLT